MSQKHLPRRPALPPQFLDPTTPVFFDETHQSWNVFRYADVLRVLTNAEEFSQDYATLIDIHPTYAGLWLSESPRHSDLRAIAAEPFRPQVLARFAPRIRQMADELLDAILASGTGHFELVGELARPLACRVICEILGVDLSNEKRFIAWVDENMATLSLGEMVPQPDLVAFLTQMLQERREHPQNGLVDDLLRAHATSYLVAGQPLSEWDLIGYCWMLLSAGLETTATGMGNILLALAESGTFEELRENRDLIPGAIEEGLRWNTSSPGLPLYAKKDLEIGGQHIAAGQMVTAWMSAANRDPLQFPNPETFDIRRYPNKHLSFGWGRHHCLGMPLAQLELKIALEALLDTLPLPIQRESEREPIYQFGTVTTLREAHFRFPVPASG